MKLAPRPPYSLGQEIPTHPAACIFFCQATRFSSVSRSGATRWSAASSTQISAGRFSSSQWRNSARKAACSGLSAKSKVRPLSRKCEVVGRIEAMQKPSFWQARHGMGTGRLGFAFRQESLTAQNPPEDGHEKVAER